MGKGTIIPRRHLCGTEALPSAAPQPKSQLEAGEWQPIPSSLMTLGWSKSFMHAASLRNSSISLWEKLSTGKQKKEEV